MEANQCRACGQPDRRRLWRQRQITLKPRPACFDGLRLLIHVRQDRRNQALIWQMTSSALTPTVETVFCGGKAIRPLTAPHPVRAAWNELGDDRGIFGDGRGRIEVSRTTAAQSCSDGSPSK